MNTEAAMRSRYRMAAFSGVEISFLRFVSFLTYLHIIGIDF